MNLLKGCAMCIRQIKWHSTKAVPCLGPIDIWPFKVTVNIISQLIDNLREQ